MSKTFWNFVFSLFTKYVNFFFLIRSSFKKFQYAKQENLNSSEFGAILQN